MNFTDSSLEREMKRRPRPERPAPAPAPRGSRCAGCPYWSGIRCMTCFRSLLGNRRCGR